MKKVMVLSAFLLTMNIFCFSNYEAKGSKINYSFLVQKLASKIQMEENMEKIKNYTKEDILWLQRNIYFEARSENLHGQMAVAFVTINRAINHQWPDSIKDVVTQKWQFSWYNKYYGTGKTPIMMNLVARNKAKLVAEMCIELYNSMADSEGWENGIAGGALYYFADYIKPPSWSKDLVYVGKIGPHLLYKDS